MRGSWTRKGRVVPCAWNELTVDRQPRVLACCIGPARWDSATKTNRERALPKRQMRRDYDRSLPPINPRQLKAVQTRAQQINRGRSGANNGESRRLIH